MSSANEPHGSDAREEAVDFIGALKARRLQRRLLASAPTPLPTVVDEINAEHKTAQSHQKQSVEHAIRCGELLLRAKDQIGHGEWTKWLAANVTSMSETTARGYMRLAQMEPAKRQRVAVLTLRSALRSIADASQRPRRLEYQANRDATPGAHPDTPLPAVHEGEATHVDDESSASEADTVIDEKVVAPGPPPAIESKIEVSSAMTHGMGDVGKIIDKAKQSIVRWFGEVSPCDRKLLAEAIREKVSEIEQETTARSIDGHPSAIAARRRVSSAMSYDKPGARRRYGP